MSLFRSRFQPNAPDPRLYELTEAPLVAGDDRVVLVDLTLRFDPAPPREGERGWQVPWDDAWDQAVHAVVLVALRLVAEEHPAEDLYSGRALVENAVRRHVAVSPAPVSFPMTPVSVEVQRHHPDFAFDWSIRPLTR